ncbi:hypothetical protein ACFOQM_08640 [Paenibacillus sp. GCM10012307]|uniref:Uncharacterized protein n=1 Tax=Paenibacillus roseus TaxID=2798579 RepID=A0A934J4G1_9BACL|nr:hypothetical protein [Paenibacillus roseus]MBJ6361353.1 hypothetical protein [Paenibacillus roseus]
MRTKRALIGYRSEEVVRYVELLQAEQESLLALQVSEEAEFEQEYHEKMEQSLSLQQELKSVLNKERMLAEHAGAL